MHWLPSKRNPNMNQGTRVQDEKILVIVAEPGGRLTRHRREEILATMRQRRIKGRAATSVSVVGFQ